MSKRTSLPKNAVKKNRFRAAILAFSVVAAGLGGVAAQATPAFADASCTGGASVYGVLSDGRLSYTVINPANGNITHVITSTKTLGFTPKAIATLNFNTVLITSTTGVLYRVDIVTNDGSLTFNDPVDVQHGWTHNLLTYDGH